MRTSKIVSFLATAAVLALMTFAGAALAAHHELKIGKNDKIGSYLTDTKGMTLYVFKKDSSGKSACAGE